MIKVGDHVYHAVYQEVGVVFDIRLDLALYVVKWIGAGRVFSTEHLEYLNDPDVGLIFTDDCEIPL